MNDPCDHMLSLTDALFFVLSRPSPCQDVYERVGLLMDLTRCEVKARCFETMYSPTGRAASPSRLRMQSLGRAPRQGDLPHIAVTDYAKIEGRVLAHCANNYPVQSKAAFDTFKRLPPTRN